MWVFVEVKASYRSLYLTFSYSALFIFKGSTMTTKIRNANKEWEKSNNANI